MATTMVYPIHESRHEPTKLSLFVPALEVMHPMLLDRQTDRQMLHPTLMLLTMVSECQHCGICKDKQA